MSNLKNITDLHKNYVNTGKLQEGFDKYYAEDVIMQEVGEAPRIGKHLNLQYEMNVIKTMQEVHSKGILSISEDIENNKTMVETWMDLTFTNGIRIKIQQVAVQSWKNGRIVNEMVYPGNHIIHLHAKMKQ